jgi:hypothetical protein
MVSGALHLFNIKIKQVSLLCASLQSMGRFNLTKLINMNRKTLTIIFAIVAAVIVGGFLFSGNSASDNSALSKNLRGRQVTLYKDPNCGCCDLYAAHLRRASFIIDIHEEEDMSSIKEKFGVPQELQSCHTSIIENRIIEGHMPIEGIQALFNQDEIKAISLPGMPGGSPGMSGTKKGSFTVYSFGKNIEPMKFMEL